MTANWKVVRITIMWLFIAIFTMAIVIASPYAVKSEAASPNVKVQKISNGKWGAYVNGKLDQSITGFYKNQNGWWYVKNGYVDFSANGIYKNKDNGVWYKTTNGKVTFKETGVFKNYDNNSWWRVVDSRVDFQAYSIYKNENGWWKTTNGRVTFQENGVFKNEKGWWKVVKSKVDFDFNGIASNENGTWYLDGGRVLFEENGKVYYDLASGKNYLITNGRATEITNVDPTDPTKPEEPSTPGEPSEPSLPLEPVLPDDQEPTSGEDNKALAVEVAKETVKEYPISRALLIEIMMDEDVGFTEEEAIYGVDNCGANWKEQAVLVASELLFDEDTDEPNGVSRESLKEILADIYEFTDSEVAYALSVVDDDAKSDANFWNKQALVLAKEIVAAAKEENTTLSSADIKDILVEDGQFTSSQAEYAASRV